jgi:hypothetical protein
MWTPTEALPPLAPGVAGARTANDNAFTFTRPIVRALRRRPDETYARSANVILPLRFAENMPGWRRPGCRRT